MLSFFVHNRSPNKVRKYMSLFIYYAVRVRGRLNGGQGNSSVRFLKALFVKSKRSLFVCLILNRISSVCVETDHISTLFCPKTI